MTLEEYLAELAHGLDVYLRPFRGKLSPRWLGIDRRMGSWQLHRSEQGFSATLSGRWMGEPVVVGEWRRRAGIGLLAEFPAVKDLRPRSAVFEDLVNILAGPGRLVHGPERPGTYFTGIHPDYTMLLAIVGPVHLLTTREQDPATSRWPVLTPSERRASELPTWCIGLVSNFPRAEELSGLDDDPLLTARAFVDAILVSDGLRAVSRADQHRNAARQLRRAVASASEENERVLQTLLKQLPWILMERGEYDDSVLFEPRLRVTERMSDQTSNVTMCIPDIIYHLPDSTSLVVEIEAATKGLFTSATETGYLVPTARTSRASFQIKNYRNLFERSPSEVKHQLGKPDAWGFQYLLVVGSASQPGFDERSWLAFVEDHRRDGIVVRHWDYYIDRLERFARIASFSGSHGTDV